MTIVAIVLGVVLVIAAVAFFVFLTILADEFTH